MMSLTSPDSSPQPDYGDHRRRARWTGSSADWLQTWRECCQETSDEGLTPPKKEKENKYFYTVHQLLHVWMIHEEFFNTFSCVMNNKTHPRQGATAATWTQRPCLCNLTCTNGVSQRGVVLGSQQRLVITRVALQLLLSTTGCHPDPGSVLVGHAFAHVPFHFEKDRLV